MYLKYPNTNISGLLASKVVATDSNKNLTSLDYGTTITANSLVQRDGNGNAFANNFNSKLTNITTSGGITILTASSSGIIRTTGTQNHQFNLPVGTTLTNGFWFKFHNASTGAVSVYATDGTTLIGTIAGGGADYIICSDSSTSNGSFSVRSLAPSNVSWGTSGLNLPGILNLAGLTASQAVVTDANKDLISLAYGSSSVASTLTSRDANGNSFANNFNSNALIIAASGGVSTLTVSSAKNIIISGGSGGHTVRLPDVSTLGNGFKFCLVMDVDAALGIQTSGSNTLAIVSGKGSIGWVTVVNSAGGSGTASWNIVYATNLLSAGSLVSRSGSNVTNLGGTFVTSLTSTGFVSTLEYRSAVVTLTDGSTVTPNFAAGSNFKWQIGGNRTLGVPTNLAAGQNGVINIFQDSTGSRVISFAWAYRFPNGSATVLSVGKFARDKLSYYVDGYSTATVTVTIATPGVMSWSAHGFVSGQVIQLSTTGALPTGLAASTSYWVNVIDANTFNLSSSLANLQAGIYIATSGSQSGVHTATNASISIFANTGMA